MKRTIVLIALALVALSLPLIANIWIQDYIQLTGTASNPLELTGAATVWDDVVVPVVAIRASGAVAAPGWAVYPAGPTNLETYWFDAASDECVDISVQIPHRAKIGADYYECHVHWTPHTTADGTPASQIVDWELTYIIQDIGDAVPGEATTDGHTHLPADANVVAGKHYYTEMTHITATSFGISAILLGRLCRDANDATNDTYEHDAGILGFDCHVEINRMGSLDEASN